MIRWISLLCLLTFVLGCGSAKKPTSKNGAKPKPKPTVQEAPVTPEVTLDAFPNFDAAMAAVVAGVADSTKASGIAKAEKWMGLQGAAIQPQLIAKAKDPNANIAERVSCLRTYGRMGNVATPLMMELSKPDVKPDMLRINAVQCLGMPEHPDKEALERLCDLVSDKDVRIRRAALHALRVVGKDAKKQRPEIVKQLQDLANSMTDDDEVRKLAKVALKEIEPRIGFSGMGKADK